MNGKPYSHHPKQTPLEAANARISSLEDDLKFVERWAVHHGTKSHMTAENALSIIQHYPPISAITKSYADGKIPDTFNPFARITELEAQLEAHPTRVRAKSYKPIMAYGYTDVIHELQAQLEAFKTERKDLISRMHTQALKIQQLADAKQVANDCIIVADNAIAEARVLKKDAERYQRLRRGQKWSVIDGIGDTLRAEGLDEAIDAAIQAEGKA